MLLHTSNHWQMPSKKHKGDHNCFWIINCQWNCVVLGFPVYHCSCFGSMGGKEKVNFSSRLYSTSARTSPHAHYKTCAHSLFLWKGRKSCMSFIQSWVRPLQPVQNILDLLTNRHKTMRGRCLGTVWSPLIMTVRLISALKIDGKLTVIRGQYLSFHAGIEKYKD